ncbi:P-type conjugative transfer protein TrbJ [Desulfosarcina sp. OttesenSCG-928-A07]|nr:P-type conjugative transfer protein TrbJ [Desulfosarcina sp. OttesenSCG-928-G17]MDL2328469.1 P-type conjugative transfer protein TrbJ [Desulfosarcina sp. OttesenSCG-928-A07]
MKKILVTLSLSLVLAVSVCLLHIAPARAIYCSNCSTEVGEALRQVESIAQMVEQIARLDQQIKMMKKNLEQLPDLLKNQPVQGMNRLAQLATEAVTLKADQNAMIQIFNELYPEQSTLADLANASDAEIEEVNAQYQAHYDEWSEQLNTGILGTFQVSARQLQEMTKANNAELENYIANLLQTPEGAQQALEAANQLAALQLKDSMALRELIASMAQGQALRDAKAEKMDEAAAEEWKASTKTEKLDTISKREAGKKY